MEWCAAGGDRRVVTPEQLAAGRKHLEEVFVKMLGIREDENKYWVGFQTDLVELVRLAWEAQLVRNADGTPASMAALVSKVFAALHMVEPANPYSVVARARRRKGVFRQTLLERYCWLKYVKGVENPLDQEIVAISKQASPQAGEHNPLTAGPNPHADAPRQPQAGPFAAPRQMRGLLPAPARAERKEGPGHE